MVSLLLLFVLIFYLFSKEELERVLPEGFPPGMEKEFEETMRHALLIRQSFLDLRDNFRRVVDPPMYPTAKGERFFNFLFFIFVVLRRVFYSERSSYFYRSNVVRGKASEQAENCFSLSTLEGLP